MVKINDYFAHPETILITILGDDNKNIQNRGVTKVLQFANKVQLKKTQAWTLKVTKLTTLAQ